jgi:hypothetical protein
VIHISDANPNDWINIADSSWSGAIPATLMFKKGSKMFFKEGKMEDEDLKSNIVKYMEAD